MTLSIASFPNLAGLTGAPRRLVEFSEATRLAFLDAGRAGNADRIVSLIDQGLQAGQEVEQADTLECGDAPIAINVTSKGAAHFSLFDGHIWQGPFALVSDVRYSMLVRSSVGNPEVRVKVQAVHASQRVLVEVAAAVNPEQLAVVRA